MQVRADIQADADLRSSISTTSSNFRIDRQP
jgi:hypothetical protein